MTCNAILYIISVTRYRKGAKVIAEKKSRAEYMKSRRQGKKTFSALIAEEKAEAIERKLRELNKTKTAWLEEKIDAETKQ